MPPIHKRQCLNLLAHTIKLRVLTSGGNRLIIVIDRDYSRTQKRCANGQNAGPAAEVQHNLVGFDMTGQPFQTHACGWVTTTTEGEPGFQIECCLLGVGNYPLRDGFDFW